MEHFCEVLQHSSWIISLDSSIYISTFFEICHYAGFFLLVGSIALVDLRVLGIAGRGQTPTAMAQQLFPWMWVGVVFAFLSGFFLFAADAVDFYGASYFRIKILMLVVALAVSIFIEWQVPRWDRKPAIPAGAKTIALISLLLWVATIVISSEVPAINGVG